MAAVAKKQGAIFAFQTHADDGGGGLSECIGQLFVVNGKQAILGIGCGGWTLEQGHQFGGAVTDCDGGPVDVKQLFGCFGGGEDHLPAPLGGQDLDLDGVKGGVDSFIAAYPLQHGLHILG